MTNKGKQAQIQAPQGAMAKFLDWIEWLGNKLPDPAILFFICMVTVWVLSWLLSGVTFTEINPKTGEAIQINNMLAGSTMATFFAGMVKTFTDFAPLGIVLVAMLGVGVAEHSGYINAGLKWMLGFTPKGLLTPVLIFVAILSHTATDAGYVLVIPLGGVIFYAAGRHPLAGIVAAFAGVSGGFSANPIPSGIDPLLQSFTQTAAQIIDPAKTVNPLCNWYFTGASSIVIILVGWFLTDRVIEPRLNSHTPVDNDAEPPTKIEKLTASESRSFWAGSAAMILGLIALAAIAIPSDSILRNADGYLERFDAPLMQMIVPLIFVFFLIPGVVYGLMAGTFKNSKDIIMSMKKAMDAMTYYIVMAFFCALFLYAFNNSNIGALMALKGAAALKAMNLPPQVTIIGIIFLTAFVNLAVGSASAKWGLLGPIFVPILMQVGISPDLAQAAYRVGDSCSNIITPLMPYFPLVVVFAQKYVKKTGIGTLVSLMLPYTILFMITWSIFLLIYWGLGIPLGVDASYVYTPATP
ncbi:AbgT family transporter [Sulfidibacter corallicola]|uniref:AbgT family transporter n=1 Tax=Sulfidibacter corallicola TaxID=2818388 RepID=A0A8A4TPW8_SULCO|nr:AbgT family transporter [Sulfidibacter corallicola]QTD51593.1 AbgT family transporter [Sulfidibacter corallicola]